MLKQTGTTIIALAFFTSSKVGKTGLTVTLDAFRGTSTSAIVTAASATELGDGLYYYTLSSTNNTTAGLYTFVFKTTDSTVDQQWLPACYVVGDTWVQNVDTNVSSRAPSILDFPNLSATLAALITRCYLITTGTTVPASADQWAVQGLYNNVPYYGSKSTSLFAWYNGANWIISSVLGTNGTAYWLGGTNVTSAYTAQGTATGTPAAVAHGNSMLATFQPDITLPTTDTSGRVTVVSNVDKGGYSLATPPPTAVQVRQEIDNNSTQLATIVTNIASVLTAVGGIVAGVWSAAVRTLSSLANVTVGGYATNQDPGTYVLSTPANKLATDGAGRVGANNLPTDYAQRNSAPSWWVVPDNSDVATALSDLVTLIGRTDPTTALASISAVTAKLGDMISGASPNEQFSAHALALAPTGSSSTVEDVAAKLENMITGSGAGTQFTAAALALVPGGYYSLSAGAIALVSRTTTTIQLAATGGVGGTGPYTLQWQRSPTGAGTWANEGTGASGLPDTGLSAGTTYDYRLKLTDSLGTIAYTGILTVSTLAAGSVANGYFPVYTVTYAGATTQAVGGNGPIAWQLSRVDGATCAVPSSVSVTITGPNGTTTEAMRCNNSAAAADQIVSAIYAWPSKGIYTVELAATMPDGVVIPAEMRLSISA